MQDQTNKTESALTTENEGAVRSSAGLGDWLPIHTAPRDGTRVIVWIDDRHFRGCAFASVWFFPDGRLGGGAEGFNGQWNITHWMPLPKSPNSMINHQSQQADLCHT